jgi:hypothetical protein
MSLAACAISSGITLDCRDSQGGIEYVYIANADGVVTFDLVSGSTCEIDSISVDGTPLTSGDFYKFEVPKQTSSYTETVNASTENGTVFYQQDVALVFNKLQCSTRNQMLLLAQNTKLLVIVKDGNGNFWTAGLTRGCEMTAGSNGTGTAYGDRNGYTLTLTGLEPDPMYNVDPVVVGE